MNLRPKTRSKGIVVRYNLSKKEVTLNQIGVDKKRTFAHESPTLKFFNKG